jgi:hypothetical protein
MSTFSDSGYITSVFSIIISLSVFAVSIYLLLRINTLNKKIDDKVSENQARIGRLIRELNIIHDAKRELDKKQNDSLHSFQNVVEQEYLNVYD